MSINACSINEHSINSLCGRRRQAIINSLLPPATGGGQQQHVHPDTKVPLNIFRRDASREETVVDFSTLELPYIQVTVEMDGQSFTQTLDRDDTVPMINVYSVTTTPLDEAVTVHSVSIKTLNEAEAHVNISDITLRIIK